MEKVYKSKNGTIHVTIPDECDRDKLQKATEEFLKKVIRGGTKNGDSYTRTNF